MIQLGRSGVVALSIAMAVAATACGSNSSDDAGTAYSSSGRTIEVPGDVATINDAVSQAKSGDLVLVAPGVYPEEVQITVPGIVLRGADRNTTILDGDHSLENGIVVEADGVAIENLTVRNYVLSGVSVSRAYDADNPESINPIVGYRMSYLTAANNGLHGLYAFAARGGVIEHSYASGHPDSGIYVGQCRPCDALVTDSIGEFNAVGYLGTNASTNIFVVNSIWRHNRIGMMTNSQNVDKLAPQVGGYFAGNVVVDNAETATPETESGGFGFGIVIGGGTENRVVNNLVSGHPVSGMVLTDLDGFAPLGNEVRGNRFETNGVDISFHLSTEGEASGNCFTANQLRSTEPPDLQSIAPCGTAATGGPMIGTPTYPVAPPGFDYRSVPLPPDQRGMDNPLGAPAVPALPMPAMPELASISTPKRPT